ncbi:MFS transporter [Paraferrimonas sp. SM1919]|uniref:AmpG family muropeptide MFS transporter n=1 Tax=Paraferrimonas sp. SM1919 TaxID=2662263 RepID=UPI0013D4C49C|nr:MFS transporter [Paraferrimonas sp. SM1919]
MSALSGFKVYGHRKVISLLLLGFAAGLPLMLVFSTLSFWLREAGVSRSEIGYFSWIAAIYGFKFLWAPLVDRIKLPILNRLLGQRRSWMLLAQLVVIIAILIMSQQDPQLQLQTMALAALLLAFASATQDIVIDGFRIESAENKLQGAMAAAYQAGYRTAMIIATAGALTFAAWVSPDNDDYNLIAWQQSYIGMAALMLIGIITTLFVSEPKHKNVVSRSDLPWLVRIFVEPFQLFWQRFGKQALWILLLICTYRISDIVMGIMANVFYVDMGFSKQEIATLSKVFGVIMTLVGGAAGGVLVLRYGTHKILYLGALLVAITNLLFALQAHVGYQMQLLALIISVDNFSAGVATAAFIAYLSSLTSEGYSASQYAILSSIMLLFPKFVAGFSGEFVDAYGYIWFFSGAAIIGFPVLWFVSKANQQSTQ